MRFFILHKKSVAKIMTYARQVLTFNEAKYWSNQPILAEAKRMVANYNDTTGNRYITVIGAKKW